MTARFVPVFSCVELRKDMVITEEARKGLNKLGACLQRIVCAVTAGQSSEDCRDDLHRGEEMLGSLYRQYFKESALPGAAFIFLVKDTTTGTVLPLVGYFAFSTRGGYWNYAGRQHTMVRDAVHEVFRKGLFDSISAVFPPAGWYHHDSKYITTIPGHNPYTMTRFMKGPNPTAEQLLDGEYWRKRGVVAILGIDGSMSAYVRKNNDGTFEMINTIDVSEENPDILGTTSSAIYRFEISKYRMRLTTVAVSDEKDWRLMNVVNYRDTGRGIRSLAVLGLLTVMMSAGSKVTTVTEKSEVRPTNLHSIWSTDRIAEPDPTWGMTDPRLLSYHEYTHAGHTAYLVFYGEIAKQQ